MSKFLTCVICKEDYFYTDDHQCTTYSEVVDLSKPSVKELRKTCRDIIFEGSCPIEMQTFLNHVRDNLKELDGHRNKWGGETVSWHPMMLEQVRQNNELYAENKKLKGALEKYGLHHQCPKWKGSTIKCTCGLDEALNPTKEK